jgi:hypothetical protein
MPKWLLLVIIIAAIQLVYSVVACLVFRNRIRTSQSRGFNMQEMTERRALLRAWLICAIASVLPYRAREGFLLIVHFFVHSVKTNVLIVVRAVSRIVVWGALAVVYFLGFPVALLAKGSSGKEGTFASFAETESSITRRF